MTSTSKRRPASFLVGIFILLACLISLYLPLRPVLLPQPVYATSTPTLLPCLVLIASVLNSVSHTAVILNLLQDTMIISILIGVSFDVLSELLYLSFWIQLSKQFTLPKSFVLVYATFATYHLIVHVRALLMTRSFRRLESVVRSAYHNIIGYPGDCYYLDHVFAFSDTAFHWFHVGVVSLLVVGMGRSVQIIGSAVMAIAMLDMVRQSQSFARGKNQSNQEVSPKQERHQNSSSTLSRSGDQPICSCKTCVQSPERTNGAKPGATAFCIRMQDFRLSVCDLWQKSFREALSMIDECNTKAHTN